MQMCTKNTATILRQRGGGTYVVKKSETSLPSRGFPSLLEEEEEDKKNYLPPSLFCDTTAAVFPRCHLRFSSRLALVCVRTYNQL